MIRSTETGLSQPWDVNNTTTEFADITLFKVPSNLCTTFGIRQTSVYGGRHRHCGRGNGRSIVEFGVSKHKGAGHVNRVCVAQSTGYFS